MEGIDALLGKTKSCWRGSTLSATWFCCNLSVVTGKIGSCYFIFETYRQVVTLFLILTGKLLLYFWYSQASCYFIFDTHRQVVTLFLILTGKLLLYFWYSQASCYFIFDPHRQVVTLFLILTGKLLFNFWYKQGECRTARTKQCLCGCMWKAGLQNWFFFFFTFGLQNLEEKKILVSLNRKKIIYDFEKRKKMHAIKLIQKLNDRLYANNTKQARQVSRMQWKSSFAV